MNFENYRQLRVERIEEYLCKLLPKEPIRSNSPPRLYEAMRYSTLNGGKRIRPLLVYAVGEALGNPLELLDAPAAAVELIHCYSLIHDDLPAMDNDDLRRGMPTCHIAFDEATAILAGDALQSLAFQIIADPILNPIFPQHKIEMIQNLADKSGLNGMVGGQALDIASENSDIFITISDLRDIHQKKTGALIEACVTFGALASREEIDRLMILKLQDFARCIGLAFQIQDDILDIIGDIQTMGKTIGKDQIQKKVTYPSKLGIETAKQYANALQQQALDAIAFLNEKGNYLAQLSDMFIKRTN